MTRFDLEKSPLKGTHLLEASAGTGKTYTIADLYLRLVAEEGLEIEKILVVTFTVAATEELRDRLRNRLKEAGADPAADPLRARRIRRALADFDRASVYTIHGFCQRTLMEHAFESGSLFDTELVADDMPLIAEAVEDFWRTRFYRGNKRLLSYVLGRMGLADLYTLARKTANNPKLAVIPEYAAPDEEALEKALDAAEDAFREAADIWSAESGAIREDYIRMAESGALNAKSFQMQHAPGRLEKLDAFLSGGNPHASVDAPVYFTRARLREGARDESGISDRRFYDACGRFMDAAGALDRRLHAHLVGVKRDLIDYVARDLEKTREVRNRQTFNDLLTALHRALRGPFGRELAASVRKKFPAALIDEFQDTDSLQYDIFISLFGNSGGFLYLVGDPKQSIYRFRGADIFAYMRAAASVESRRSMDRNWRSVPELVKAVNAVFGPLKNPFVFDEKLIGFPPVEPGGNEVDRLESPELDPAPMQVWFLGKDLVPEGKKNITAAEAERMIAGATAAEISRIVSLGAKGKAIIGGRGVTPGDIAVLVRKRTQADLVRRELSEAGVPAVICGTESVYRSAASDELARILRGISRFESDRNIKAALATNAMGHSAAEIFRMSEDGAAWEETVLRFSRYRDLWAEDGFIRMFRQFLADENVFTKVLVLNDGERRMTDILHLAELLHRRETAARPSIDELLTWFSDALLSADESEEAQIRLETDEDAVKLMTVHGSKGLQFPVVFCPFLWRGIRDIGGDFVFYRGDPASEKGGLVLDIGSDESAENRRIAAIEELAESVRLFYVGITRAKCRCYVAWGMINGSDTSSQAWVFHQPSLEGGGDIVQALGGHVKKLGEAGMRDDLARLEERSGGTIRVSEPPGKGVPFRRKKTAQRDLACREFSGTIDSGWSIASYSSLNEGTSPSPEEAPDRDRSAVVAAPGGYDDIAAFPPGVTAGSCIHAIFEKLDFTSGAGEGARAAVDNELARFGFDSRWGAAVADMVRRVTAARLDADGGLALEKISAADRLTELEFYYPLKTITDRGLAAVLEGAKAGNAVHETAGGPVFSPRRGFMRGFIDLVFRWNGRYYIVDWKSNRLGDAKSDYSAGAVAREMSVHNYALQYHLYTVALHRYLQIRVSGYDYEKHFGGVYYLFVRGMDPEGPPGRGIFAHRPRRELIHKLNDYFWKGTA